jgi:hypothetical protein
LDNKSWIYGHDPETNQQSSQLTSPQPTAKKAQQVQGSTKGMPIVFFDMKGIVH